MRHSIVTRPYSIDFVNNTCIAYFFVMRQYYPLTVKQVLINKYNYKKMITTAKLTFLSSEIKEFNNDGKIVTRHYGYFVQDNSSDVQKVVLLPEFKFERFKTYDIKLNIEMASFKRDDGNYKTYLKVIQLS